MDKHCTKRTYLSKAAAKREVKKMKAFGHHDLHAYRCDWGCGDSIWHVGIANEKDRQRIRGEC